ncbi:MAG: inorganic diphosphatase [Thermoflavifilum sp.]|nr:inorganic diphosphatase [Thermoflavifilum sp.]
MAAHPWHDIAVGNQAPEIVTSIIEIPKGSRAKYELDKTSGLLKLDRVLYSSVYYPANYGFIAQSLGEDHDPLDILVLSQIDMQPLCIVRAKVIGVMQMIDNGEADDKIIAVAADDVSINHIDDIDQLPAHFINELRHFFEEYKALEHKTVVVEEFQNKQVAFDVIRKSISDYQKQFAVYRP